MHTPSPSIETIPDLLVRNIKREVVMAVDEALTVGAQRAFAAARGLHNGHMPHAVGQLRHFHMNETFHQALEAGGADPSPIRGNGIVTGRAGVFALARFNIPEGFWINGRRSKTRRHMSFANLAIEPLVQPGLFGHYAPSSTAVAFFVACFSGSLRAHPESPVSIQIAVPDRNMRGWLFREPIEVFIKRYELAPAGEHDLVIPKLKTNVRKLGGTPQ
ncbi:MAG: hypothetical protein JWR21_2009 [Herminiimonas sp.]|nr:hypothetical protein [Herminiimonas sp.]